MVVMSSGGQKLSLSLHMLAIARCSMQQCSRDIRRAALKVSCVTWSQMFRARDEMFQERADVFCCRQCVH